MRKRLIVIISATLMIALFTAGLAYAGGMFTTPNEGTSYWGMNIVDSYKGVARDYPAYTAKHGNAYFIKNVQRVTVGRGRHKKRVEHVSYTVNFADEHNLFTQTLPADKVALVWDERYGKCPIVKVVKDDWGQVVSITVFHSPAYKKTDFAPPLPSPLR